MVLFKKDQNGEEKTVCFYCHPEMLLFPLFCHKFNVVCSTWSGVMQGPGGSAECPSPGGPDECPITPTYKEMQVLLIDFFKYLIKRCSIIQQ